MSGEPLDDGRPPLTWSGRIILLIALALTAVGLLSISSGESGASDGYPLTIRQTACAGLGLCLAAAAARIGHVRIGRFAYPLFGLILVILALLVIARKVPMAPIIPLRRNTARWLQFGPVQVQPSEYAKLAYVLALASYLKFRSNYRTLRGLIPPFVLTLIPAALILKEPDLGTALTLGPVLFVMLFAAGAKLRHLGVILGLGLLAMPAFYFSGLMDDYQKQRIHVLLRQADPDRRWQMGPGFQLRQSKIAIGSGQWFGQSEDDTAFFRHNLLPEDHNDFIFAVIGHRWGLAGSALMVTLYLALAAAGLVAASATHDPFGRLVAVGMSAMLGAQALVNMGMTVGLTPITGLTLPFVSSGGSSLVANYLAVGLLVSVARHRPVRIARKPFEYRYAEDE